MKTALMHTWSHDECLFSQAGQVSITGVAERTFADTCKTAAEGQAIFDPMSSCAFCCRKSLYKAATVLLPTSSDIVLIASRDP